ncbi:MAG: penicillin acylase family protein [Streptosporangiaceae bacterium]
MPRHRRWRLIRQISNGVAAAFLAAAVLALCAFGFNGFPAIGRALDPGHGAWAPAADAQLPKPEVLRAPGLAGPTLVAFSPHGIATVQAGHLADAMVALGYLHARFRLTQMDLQRRVAEGRLSQLVGASGLASDEFELRLGLLRTARREWAVMPKNSLGARLLVAYARGVNDYLTELRANGQWPSEFTLAGVYPARWTPVDTLAVEGYLAQQLDYTTSPLDYAVLAGTLGIGRTMRWFPVQPAGQQHPFDPGPYRAARGLTPIAAVSLSALRRGSGGAARASASSARMSGGQVSAGRVSAARVSAGRVSAGRVSRGAVPVSRPSVAVVRSAAAALALTRHTPVGQAAFPLVGSAWAVNGPKVRGGGSMLAGTAALPGLLSPRWFQAAITAPGYEVTGVSLPGVPGIVIGHNKHIAWTMTSGHSQSTLYYVEKTSRSHPGDYLWRRQWRPMRRVHDTIPVRGGTSRQLTVELTMHGPLLTKPGPSGPAISVQWIGDGSPDVAALAGIGAASNFTQFHVALASWHSPAVTFVYADRHGNIGAMTAGRIPVVAHGTPWLPMPGTGADDVAGLIPYAALPLSYNPPNHVVAAAGQRPVDAGYPYYLGTSANDRDAADASGADYAVLDRRSGMDPNGVVALQTSPVSELAAHVVPRLLAALRHAALSAAERRAVSVLRGWSHQMAPASAAAAIWSVFWPDYLSATFTPWWQAARVPVAVDPAGLSVSPAQAGLATDLERWTLADPSNPVFAAAGAHGRTASSAMRAAFNTAVAQLTAQFHGGPSGWRLDRLSAKTVVSSAQVPVLGYGSSAAAMSPWLVGGAESAGGTGGAAGAGWRMIVLLSPGRAGIMAEGIYPGGQSDNPASVWHDNLTARWQHGGYLLLPPAGTPVTGPMRWGLLP